MNIHKEQFYGLVKKSHITLIPRNDQYSNWNRLAQMKEKVSKLEAEKYYTERSTGMQNYKNYIENNMQSLNKVTEGEIKWEAAIL